MGTVVGELLYDLGKVDGRAHEYLVPRSLKLYILVLFGTQLYYSDTLNKLYSLFED